MRIDAFLKSSRIIKRRTIAKQACDTGRVTKNGRPAKAGDNVDVGDEIAVRFGERRVRFRVCALIDNAKKDEATSMYEMLAEEEEPNGEQ